MRWISVVGFGLVLIGALCAVQRLRRNTPRLQAGLQPAPNLPIREICRRSNIRYPPKRVFIRAFKFERELELWGGNSTGELHLLRLYPIAAASGGPGPKRREGDMQVPEGVYRVARFNPQSRFHLSLGLDYPNAADRILGKRQHLGGDIYIHGNHLSAGCLAMTDPKIDEIYSLARQARMGVAVHIFPCRMQTPAFARLCNENPQWKLFWSQLEPIYQAFEKTRVVPSVTVRRNGSYIVES